MSDRQARGLALAEVHLKLARDFLEEGRCSPKVRGRTRKVLKNVQRDLYHLKKSRNTETQKG